MSTTQKRRVALVLPAYNEGQVIEQVIRGLYKVFNESSYDFQIIVVDDSSGDFTADLAKKSGAFVIQHVLNTGSGGATATGLSYASQNGFDMATTSDADGQHSPEDILRGVEILEKCDIDLLIGSRLIDKNGMSRVKLLGNRGLSFITNSLFGVRITDSQSGLRIFSKRALAELKWRTSGYEFCSEMLWRAKQQSLKMGEYPIRAIYTDYSRAKGQNNWNAINIIKSLVQRRIVEMFE